MKRERIETVRKHVVYQTECDACHKIAECEDPDGWLNFNSHHNDWGNDSIESLERWDVCSAACYLGILRRVIDEYTRDSPQNSTLEVDYKDLSFLRDLLTLASVTQSI